MLSRDHDADFMQPAETRLQSPKRFVAFLVGAGLLNALIAAFILCRLPDTHAPSLVSVLIRALLYVCTGVVAGMAGAWLYWRRSSHPSRRSFPVAFSLFALTCAVGWVWVPVVSILSDQDSAGAVLFSAIGASLLAAGLRRVIPFADTDSDRSDGDPHMMFADSLHSAPHSADGFVIAICIYATGYALHDRSTLTAAGLIALSAFLFTWNWTLAPAQAGRSRDDHKQAAMRLARVGLPAVLITAWALLSGVAHRNHSAANGTAFARGDSSGNDDARKKAEAQASPYGLGGYQSLVLWPYPPKEQIVPPLPARSSLLAPGVTQPVVIRFDGAYWYFQVPRKEPGGDAHQARGTPVNVNIHSTNYIPVVMQAHQHLGSPVPLRRCREIQVEVENRDNHPGTIALAMLLSESTSPNKPSLYLGQQTLASSLPEHFTMKSSPVFETLRFVVQAHAAIRQFDAIHVMVLPDMERSTEAPKIAITQFQLFPR